MTESAAIKTIKQPDVQVYDLQEAARLILGKYSALKRSHKAGIKILRALNDRTR